MVSESVAPHNSGTRCFVFQIDAFQNSSAEFRGKMVIHVQRNPQANVNTLRFQYPVPYLKKIFKSAQDHKAVFKNFSFFKPSLENAFWDQ